MNTLEEEDWGSHGASRKTTKLHDLTCKLTGAANYEAWRRSLSSSYFKFTQDKADINQISLLRMINVKFYTEEHPDLSTEFLQLNFPLAAVQAADITRAKGKTKVPTQPVMPVTPTKRTGPGSSALNKKLEEAHLKALEAYNDEVYHFKMQQLKSKHVAGGSTLPDLNHTT